MLSIQRAPSRSQRGPVSMTGLAVSACLLPGEPEHACELSDHRTPVVDAVRPLSLSGVLVLHSTHTRGVVGLVCLQTFVRGLERPVCLAKLRYESAASAYLTHAPPSRYVHGWCLPFCAEHRIYQPQKQNRPFGRLCFYSLSG
ncbi:MAG: hypothetical protein QG636_293 [Patescibacteria group bacterium]|nr:hypothetical protein [Patescibacteria group bacterium]